VLSSDDISKENVGSSKMGHSNYSSAHEKVVMRRSNSGVYRIEKVDPRLCYKCLALMTVTEEIVIHDPLGLYKKDHIPQENHID